jgi:hypothetical protein
MNQPGRGASVVVDAAVGGEVGGRIEQRPVGGEELRGRHEQREHEVQAGLERQHDELETGDDEHHERHPDEEDVHEPAHLPPGLVPGRTKHPAEHRAKVRVLLFERSIPRLEVGSPRLQRKTGSIGHFRPFRHRRHVEPP